MNDKLNVNERIDDLGRSGLRIIQNPAAPCFACDAIILADFCPLKPKQKILEFGTGSGIISILLANREPSCQIDAIEIMPPMAALAQRNISLNKLDKQINIKQNDLLMAADIYGKAQFDLVVTNPPYYANGCGKQNNDALFLAARSEVYASAMQIMQSAADVLKTGGHLAFIHRASRFNDIIYALHQAKLRVKLLRFIQPKPEQDANLFLVLAQKGGNCQSQILPPLIIYQDNGDYGQEMSAIYNGNNEVVYER